MFNIEWTPNWAFGIFKKYQRLEVYILPVLGFTITWYDERKVFLDLFNREPFHDYKLDEKLVERLDAMISTVKIDKIVQTYTNKKTQKVVKPSESILISEDCEELRG